MNTTRNIFIASTLSLSLANIAFAAVAPSASLVVPTANMSVPQNQVISFYGEGTALPVPPGTEIGSYTVDVGGNSIGSSFNPADSTVWVTGMGKTAVLDVFSGSLVRNLSVAIGIPKFDSFTNSMWAAINNNAVGKLNAMTGAVIGTWSTPGGTNVAFDPSTNSVWVANWGQGSNSVTKHNAITGALVGTYTLGGGMGEDIVFDPSTKSIWVTTWGSSVGPLVKIRPSDGAIIGSYPAGAGWTLAFDSATNSIWTANYKNPGAVTKVRASDGAVLGVYPTGGNSPMSITYDPINRSIWVINNSSTVCVFTDTGCSSRTLVQFDAITGNIVGTFPFSTNAWNIAFDSATNSLWAASFGTSWGSTAPITVKKISTGGNSITAYEWREGNCDTGTLLSSNQSFNLATPTVGTRTIYLRVRDSQGLWSTNCPSRVITVTPPSTNGACGSSHQGTFSSRPTTGLCSVGTAVPSPVAGGANGPWYWDCVGSNGGTTASCNALTNVVAGVCGSANGTPTATAPTTNLCSQTSSVPTVTGSGPWNWTCFGANGGANASCTAPKSSVCGDGTCQTGESFLMCPKDCKSQYQQF